MNKECVEQAMIPTAGASITIMRAAARALGWCGCVGGWLCCCTNLLLATLYCNLSLAGSVKQPPPPAPARRPHQPQQPAHQATSKWCGRPAARCCVVAGWLWLARCCAARAGCFVILGAPPSYALLLVL